MRIMLAVTAEATAANFLVGFASHLARRGHDVVIVANGVESLRSAPIGPVELMTVAMRRNPDPLRDVRSLFGMLRAVRAHRPDVIVYATPKASLLAAVAGRLAGVRSRVYNLWGLRLETATGAMFRILWLLEKLTIRLSTEVIANSPSLARRTEELGLAAPGSIQVVGKGSSHGVDVEKFSPLVDHPDVDPRTRAFLDGGEGLVVGFVGRLHVDKGVDTVVEAVQACAARGVRIRLLLIGSDDGLLRGSNLRDQAADGVVHLVGGVKDPRPYYAAMDVLVLMSKREGFPNVVLEAAAMGVPAVVSDATGVVDSVVDGETGATVELGRADQLADTLAALAADSARVSTLGRRAREWVGDHFEQEDVWLANEQAIVLHCQRDGKP